MLPHPDLKKLTTDLCHQALSNRGVPRRLSKTKLINEFEERIRRLHRILRMYKSEQQKKIETITLGTRISV